MLLKHSGNLVYRTMTYHIIMLVGRSCNQLELNLNEDMLFVVISYTATSEINLSCCLRWS